MASPDATDFRQYSEGIVRDFLQTIMVVDDRAYFEDKESKAVETDVTAPGPPRFGSEASRPPLSSSSSDNSDIVQSETESSEEAIEKEPLVDRAHELNAKKLIEDFAEKGMICAVIRPRDVEVASLQDKVYPLAENCDIIVFDWVLYGATDGGKVKELINEITKRSSDAVKRIRLIVVYTGQEDLAAITNDIKTALGESGQANVSAKGDYTLEAGPVRIAVYAKGHVQVAAENTELAARVLKIDQLPEKLIAEFTDMTMGLVSNVVIASLAALRSNTHTILTKFHPGLDAPFLSHRAMLEQPDDAGNLLAYLIGSEFTAILEAAEVSKLADMAGGIDIIRLWLEQKAEGGYDFPERFTEIPNSTLTDILELLRKGVGNDHLKEALKRFRNRPETRKLTEKFASDPLHAPELEYQFAILTSIKSDYRQERPPKLITGTLLKQTKQLKKGAKTLYWVCIQPICNCVRLDEITSFPMLPLDPVAEKKPFDLVLPGEDGNYIRVKIANNPERLAMKRFEPAKDGMRTVKAAYENDGFYFRATRGQRYRWIADLKFEHAQRILNRYGATISHVGLEESEWLRRSAK